MSMRTKPDFDPVDKLELLPPKLSKSQYELYTVANEVKGKSSTKSLFERQAKRTIKDSTELAKKSYVDLLSLNPDIAL
jgi:hypothetical protein